MKALVWLIRAGAGVVGAYVFILGLPKSVTDSLELVDANPEVARLLVLAFSAVVLVVTVPTVRTFVSDQLADRRSEPVRPIMSKSTIDRDEAIARQTTTGAGHNINASGSTLNFFGNDWAGGTKPATGEPVGSEPIPEASNAPPDADRSQRAFGGLTGYADPSTPGISWLQAVAAAKDFKVVQLPQTRGAEQRVVVRHKKIVLANVNVHAAGVQYVDFEDCEIYGPTVILVGNDVSFEYCVWEGAGNDIGTLLWEQPADRVLVGAILIRNCSFRRCNIRGVGLAGTKDVLDEFAAQFGRREEPFRPTQT